MDQLNGIASTSSSDLNENILDERWYFYQTKVGEVSRSPLSLRQLIRLFCPVRPGLNPILPPNTQCLSVISPDKQSQDKQKSSYGEWKAASKIDILREACANSWFWTIDGRPAEGPGTCRNLLEVIEDTKNSRAMVFAKDITSEWTAISDMKSIQLILDALQRGKIDDNNTAKKGDKSKILVDPTGNILQVDDGKQTGSDTNQEQIQDELEAFLDAVDDDEGEQTGSDTNQEQIQNELEAFLGASTTTTNKALDTDDHFYESDGGTRYVKDPSSGNWIHEALAPKEALTEKSLETSQIAPKSRSSSKKKSKKAKFSKRNAKLWIYISGLPRTGVTTEDLKSYFSKVGLLDIDPITMKPKIKLYRDRSTGELKGDASVCYARSESVDLALQILDNSLWDKDHPIKIERAHFQAKPESGKNDDDLKHVKRKRPISEAQRKVARLAILQAQDEGFGGRLTGGRKGLCIIVVKNIMNGIPEEKLESVLDEAFQKFGSIEKITCISKTRVVIVKYVEPIAASSAMESLNGSQNPRTKDTIEAIYWDGVTDYTSVPEDREKEEEEEERRHEEFGNWLEAQEDLPPELQLQFAQD